MGTGAEESDQTEKKLSSNQQHDKLTSDSEPQAQILAYAWHLKQNGRAESTIRTVTRRLKRISVLSDLHNPTSVKTTLASLKWRNSTKRTMANILTNFYKFIKIKWEQPQYTPQPTLPYIPTEEEIDSLIHTASRRMATYLQLLKETGARYGEIINYLKWEHIDFQRQLITITPEKGSNSRILPISKNLVAMINNLRRSEQRVFPTTTESIRKTYHSLRSRAIIKLGNERLKQISFHTFRHWKGTTEYHKTRDIMHVKYVLGHKTVKSTEIYIHLESVIFANAPNQYHCAIAKTIEEAQELIESGFDYVSDMDNAKLFRKRK